jgi:DNA polymerase-3 subunit alpha
MTPSFVHLHLHTEYSIVDSVVRIKELMKVTAAAGVPAVALTDQSNLFALVKFYRAALQAGIKPIIGAEIWFRAQPEDVPSRLVLLCRNNDGYRNLSRLLTRAYLDGQHDGVPIISREWLDAGTTDGLMALSGGRDGSIGRHLLAGQIEAAGAELDELCELFDGDFYLELQRTGRKGEEEYLTAAVRLAAAAGCAVVASNDVRFLRPDDFEAHEARVCIQQSRVLDDASRPRDYSAEQYLRSSVEMAELFADLPEALANSVVIAQRCNVELSLGKTYLPEYEVPQGQTIETFLEHETRQGLMSRLKLADFDEVSAIYRERMDSELAVIRDMGFPGYFLIVADFIRWSRENSIPVGPGRGSGAGSLVAWVLGITELDPIQHELLFERFLNPERVSMPDFDIDFCMEGRDRVIEYVAQRYGRDRVSQIITYGTMAAKAVVRDVGRILGKPFGFADRIAKLIPFEIGITLDKALSQEKELKELYETDDDVRTTIDLAKQIEGLVRNAGKHAGGVVISPTAITDFTPLFCVEGETSTVTQFDKDDIEAAGLVKFDFLGLRTLTIIDRAVNTINSECVGQGESVEISSIPMDDKATFELLSACNTTAVFQLESRGMRDLVKRLRPDHFDDIVALVALFRPGPLQSGMVDDFILRKHGESDQPINYFHPDLEPVLKSTYGVILYQEQVMQIAQRLSGYSLGGADILRRAMGKKKPEEMARQRNSFVDGAAERGVDRNLAARIFDLVEKFAGYGFNKSHSAAYALLAYQTAWLKAHYPAAFMAAVLSSEKGDTDKLRILKEDCRVNKLELLPPDINDSGYEFSIRGDRAIRYGLGAIKGLGYNVIDKILEVRRDGPFQDLDDFCLRIVTHRVGRRAVEALIKSGAMDALGPNRPSLMARVPAAVGAAEQAARLRDSGQVDLFGSGSDATPQAAPLKVEPDWGFRAKLLAEFESLGLFMSGHPFDEYRHDGSFVSSGTIGSLKTAKPVSKGEKSWGGGKASSAAGLVTNLSKRGGRVNFDLDDGTNRIEVTLFQEAYDRFSHLLSAHAIVVVSGLLRFDDFIDDWRLTAKEIQDIDKLIERHATNLVIRWQPIGNSRGNGGLDADRLKQILEPYRPGACDISLFLRRDNAQVRVRLGEDWSVRPSRELRERLADIVGHDGFRFIYKNALSA